MDILQKHFKRIMSIMCLWTRLYGIISWEPEGCSTMFNWEPEGRYHHKTLYSNSALLVLNGTSLNITNALLALNWHSFWGRRTVHNKLQVLKCHEIDYKFLQINKNYDFQISRPNITKTHFSHYLRPDINIYSQDPPTVRPLLYPAKSGPEHIQISLFGRIWQIST